jgi:peptidoglycan/LPS O-acetylase OafA/YrhL
VSLTAPTAGRDDLFAFPPRTPSAGRGSTEGEGAEGRLRYEPALDGIRALAVMAVLLYHGGVSWARGGFLGVDAFFVLSGFLITTLMVVEWRSTGRLDRRAFWARRARRLLPALYVCLLGFSAYSAWMASPLVRDQLRADGFASLFYVMNWRLIASSQSYFDQFYASPLRHLWSLAIEEQWYLLWPVVVGVVLHRTRSLKVLLWVCVGGALASAAWMAVLYSPRVDPSRLYYGTDTRAQSLLLGSALAVALHGWRARLDRYRWIWVLALGGVVALAFTWSQSSATAPWLYQGGFLLTAALVSLVIGVCTSSVTNPLRTVLGVAPLRWVGLISYGLYLYHWPLYLVLSPERTGLALESRRLLALRLAASFAAATISYLVIEQPVRLRRFRPPPIRGVRSWWPAPAGAALVAVAIVASTANAQRLFVFDQGMQDASQRPPPELDAPVDANEPVPAVPATRVLLVGDSVAYTYGLGFDRATSDAADVAVWNQGVLFCELVAGDRRSTNGDVFPASDRCAGWEADWAAKVDQFQPEVAVLSVGPWEIFDRKLDGSWVAFGTPDYDTELDATLQRVVNTLGAGGARVVLLTAPAIERNDAATPEWTPSEAGRLTHFNDRLRAIAAANPDRVSVIDTAEWLCGTGTCRTAADGSSLRPDGLHFSVPGATEVGSWLGPQLRVLDPRLARDGASPPSTPATAEPPG